MLLYIIRKTPEIQILRLKGNWLNVVAYTPIMPDGTFLDKGTVDNYMNSLVKEAYKKTEMLQMKN